MEQSNDGIKMSKKIELENEQIEMIIGALERSSSYYFNNCTDQSVDDEWCWLNSTIAELKKRLADYEDEVEEYSDEDEERDRLGWAIIEQNDAEDEACYSLMKQMEEDYNYEKNHSME